MILVFQSLKGYCCDNQSLGCRNGNIVILHCHSVHWHSVMEWEDHNTDDSGSHPTMLCTNVISSHPVTLEF